VAIDTGITAASIKAQITALSAAILSAAGGIVSYSRPGLSVTRMPIEKAIELQQYLYRQLERISDEGPVRVMDYTNSSGTGGSTEQDWNNATL
jgi:hypothetical protein